MKFLEDAFQRRLKRDMERARAREAADTAALIGLSIVAVHRDSIGSIISLELQGGVMLQARANDSETWIEVDGL